MHPQCMIYKTACFTDDCSLGVETHQPVPSPLPAAGGFGSFEPTDGERKTIGPVQSVKGNDRRLESADRSFVARLFQGVTQI